MANVINPPPPSYEETPSYEESTNPPRRIESRVAQDISRITIDRNLIYPVTPPATALYELSHELDAGHRTIGISRLVRTSSTEPREKHIYNFTQSLFSTTVEIVGKRRSSLSGVLLLQTYRGFVKQGWEILRTHSAGQKTETLFRTRPTRKPQKQETLQWENAEHSLVGVETVCKAGGPNSRPIFHVVGELDDAMTDALVTAWCAKIWIGWQIMIADQRDNGMDSVRRKLAYLDDYDPNYSMRGWYQ